jgi:hypothetical protein
LYNNVKQLKEFNWKLFKVIIQYLLLHGQVF